MDLCFLVLRDLRVLQQTALVRTMINILYRIKVHCVGFGLLRTKVAMSVRYLGPKWPMTEFDVQFGPRTEVTMDRITTDRIKWPHTRPKQLHELS